LPSVTYEEIEKAETPEERNKFKKAKRKEKTALEACNNQYQQYIRYLELLAKQIQEKKKEIKQLGLKEWKDRLQKLQKANGTLEQKTNTLKSSNHSLEEELKIKQNKLADRSSNHDRNSVSTFAISSLETEIKGMNLRLQKLIHRRRELNQIFKSNFTQSREMKKKINQVLKEQSDLKKNLLDQKETFRKIRDSLSKSIQNFEQNQQNEQNQYLREKRERLRLERSLGHIPTLFQYSDPLGKSKKVPSILNYEDTKSRVMKEKRANRLKNLYSSSSSAAESADSYVEKKKNAFNSIKSALSSIKNPSAAAAASSSATAPSFAPPFAPTSPTSPATTSRRKSPSMLFSAPSEFGSPGLFDDNEYDANEDGTFSDSSADMMNSFSDSDAFHSADSEDDFGILL
jgi:hypothetical protein